MPTFKLPQHTMTSRAKVAGMVEASSSVSVMEDVHPVRYGRWRVEGWRGCRRTIRREGNWDVRQFG